MVNTTKEKPVTFNLTRAVTITPVEYMKDKGCWEFTVIERNSAGKLHKARFHSTNQFTLQEKREIEIGRYRIVNAKVNADDIIIDYNIRPTLFDILYAKYKERVK
jgi:hypothetical protein